MANPCNIFRCFHAGANISFFKKRRQKKYDSAVTNECYVKNTIEKNRH